MATIDMHFAAGAFVNLAIVTSSIAVLEVA